mmetsp:Transcript_65241/g.121625  ORF Transcript_65241/g.121625 Transcript_65241/m.121625 type:complete len:731 (+) Transcript_65241:86-2278(+)
MRPLFRGEGCSIDEAGISTAGNPLARFVDGITNDPMHAQQLRDGFLGSSVRPVLGDHMRDQFLNHMRGGYPGGEEMFFDGPIGSMGMPAPGPGGPEAMMRPHGPSGADMAQLEAAWAQASSSRGPGPVQMEHGMREAAADVARPLGPPMMQPMMRPPMMGPMLRPMGMMGPPPVMASMPMQAMPVQPQVAPGPKVEEVRPQIAEAPPQHEVLEAAWQDAARQDVGHKPQDVSDDADLAQAAEMVAMLRNSGNPKFAASQFVNFIDKVAKKELTFKDNTVVDRDGQEVNWDDLYDTTAATATDAERQELQGLWNSASSSTAPGPQEAAAFVESLGRPGLGSQAPLLGPNFGPQSAQIPSMEELMEATGGDMDALQQLWGGNYDALMEEELRMAQGFNFDEDGLSLQSPWPGAGRGEHKFAEDNPYLEHLDPLAEAQRLIREGRDREALLCLEAEVQRNPDSSEGWRQLGQLFAELDQDVEAIQCLRKGHEVDPYNLDSLLALGVSCTNELDQPQALRYLRTWIENHEEHQELLEGMPPPPDYDFEGWRAQVSGLFREASKRHPNDADVFVALGVIENISRNYEGATMALAQACRLRPTDHTSWNKLGATLANSGKSEQAVIAYHQGLQLKPNYARSWSNLAIAHANLGQHTDAARFYLSSLVLNPNATHNWNFLHSAAINMEDTSIFQAIDARDLDAASKLIPGVLDPHQLPKPTLDLTEPPDAVLARMGL